MTSEAVVSLFTASLAATERALADEFTKARQAESALATAHARIHKLEMELLLARAESAQWRNRFERECERRKWESERRELQRGPTAQQSAAGDSPSMSHMPGSRQAYKESEEAPAPQEPFPPATPLKQSDDPTPPATATLQEPRSLTADSPTVEPPSVPSPHPSSLPHFTRTPALPRVVQLGPMLVKVFIEQERYPKAINLVGRLIGPSCATLKSIEDATGCVVKVFAAGTKNAFRGPPFVLIRRGRRAALANLHDAAARVQKILTPPPHGRDELWLQQQQGLREMDEAARGERVRLPKLVGSRSTFSVVRPSEMGPVSSPPPSSLPHFTSLAEPHLISSPPPPSLLPHFTLTPALPRVEPLGAMSVKVYIEQDRYPAAVNLIGRVFGPGCATLKSIESATGCALKVFSARTTSQFRGPPYVLVRRDGRDSRAGLAKVHEAAALVQKILTPPPHGRDELWLQQLQRLRVLDAERAAARAQQAKAVASRSTPAVVRPSEARPLSSPPPPSSQHHHFPLTPDQQQTTSPAFGSRSTSAVVLASEARETTGEQTTPPAFGTRSGMIPVQHLQQEQPQQQLQQFGRKKAPRGIWRL